MKFIIIKCSVLLFNIRKIIGIVFVSSINNNTNDNNNSNNNNNTIEFENGNNQDFNYSYYYESKLSDMR